jgi:hypothetical protein
VAAGDLACHDHHVLRQVADAQLEAQAPLFSADESALPAGARVMANLALDSLFGGK